MGRRARLTDGAMVRTAWNADLWPVLPVGAGTAARRAAGGSLPSALTGGQAPGPQRCERCLPLQCTHHAERWDSRREGATSELGVLPAARLGRAVPARGRRSKPFPRSFSTGRTRFCGPAGRLPTPRPSSLSDVRIRSRSAEQVGVRARSHQRQRVLLVLPDQKPIGCDVALPRP